MGPTPKVSQSGDLFRFPSAEHLKPKHKLVQLIQAMDCTQIEESFAAHFANKTGRPALPPRRVAGLLYCKRPAKSSVLKACQRRGWCPPRT